MNIDELIAMALEEDLDGTGDVTSRAIFGVEEGKAVLISKARGVLAGTDPFVRVFSTVDPSIRVSLFKNDGDFLEPGARVAEMSGKILSLLTAERTALNFLSYLSGIATKTRKMVAAASEGTTILDTRKTLPGYRMLAKYAVRIGGGKNHRMGLYDMVLIKDNHIDAVGSITEAVRRIREKWGDTYRIEVECRGLDEVREALELEVDVVMLDNMNPGTAAEAEALRRGMGKETDKGKVLFEVSGNMDEEKIKRFSPGGVDYISIGGLTHSVKAFDFSLIIER
ncbi:MAG: carboxylating nicotinate-nucleotide diphosphorylase [Spirochaetia bacterium]